MLGERQTIILKYKQGAVSVYVKQLGQESLCTTISIPLDTYSIMLSSSGHETHALGVEVKSILLKPSQKNDIKVAVGVQFILDRELYIW